MKRPILLAVLLTFSAVGCQFALPPISAPTSPHVPTTSSTSDPPLSPTTSEVTTTTVPTTVTTLPGTTTTVPTVGPTSTTTIGPVGPVGSGTASPLIWGENTGLYAGTANGDWFLSSAPLRSGLLFVHTQIIRMPARGPSMSTSGIANWAELTQAIQDTHNMGLTPLITLRSPKDPTLAQDDLQVVNYVNSVFGANTTVYYEWANEPDLEGPDVTTYTNAWNAVVPQLKAHAPGAKFIGPVSFQYDPTYIQAFLKGANPAPDAISWHEYTCSDSQTEAYCLAHIANWLNHLAAGRALMQQTIGRVLPVWITEWNYTPTITTSDPKHNDAAFLQQWTTNAMQTLAQGGVAASMHYDVQNLLPLVNTDGTMAAEGMSFRSAFPALAS